VAIALGLYHDAQIAEVLSGGIEAVPMGQIEAGAALGPRATRSAGSSSCPKLRTVVPPLNNQFACLPAMEVSSFGSERSEKTQHAHQPRAILTPPFQ